MTEKTALLLAKRLTGGHVNGKALPSDFRIHICDNPCLFGDEVYLQFKMLTDLTLHCLTNGYGVSVTPLGQFLATTEWRFTKHGN